MAAKPVPKESSKPSLHLTGSGKGPPTHEDIVALFRSLTGRDPTPEDLEESKAMYEAHVAKTGAAKK